MTQMTRIPVGATGPSRRSAVWAAAARRDCSSVGLRSGDGVAHDRTFQAESA